MECEAPQTYAEYESFVQCSAAQIQVVDAELVSKCKSTFDVIVLRQITLASGTYKITVRCADLFNGQGQAEPMIEVLE